jgi:hypothetical protein
VTTRVVRAPAAAAQAVVRTRTRWVEGEGTMNDETLVTLVGQVGEIEGDVADLADEHQVVVARLVALESRCARAEARVRELELRMNEADTELTHKADKTVVASLDEAVAVHLNLDVDAR